MILKLQEMLMIQLYILVIMIYLAYKPNSNQRQVNFFLSLLANNHMKVTHGKFHILLSTKNPIDLHLEGVCIEV